jgi:plasmid segregation protein ParM
MGSKLHFVGVDDGYAETKIVLPTGKRFRMPSQGRAGESQQIMLQEGQVSSVFTYRTPEGPFIAGALEEADTTAFDGYPTSVLNRVVVAHALRQAGIPGGQEVAIATGLPVRRYYRGKTRNDALIQAKKESLLKNDIVADDGTPLARIVAHEVVAEGIAAWIDYVIQRNAAGVLEVNKGLETERIGVVDIGGRTTDIAVVSDWEMDAARSSTLDVGMIAIRETVQGLLEDEYETTLTDAQVISAIQHKKLKLWGSMVDVQKVVAEAEQTVVARIKAETLRCLGAASDLDRVIFVGGTVMALGGQLEGWFRHQEVGADPAFANARGLLKCAEFLRG